MMNFLLFGNPLKIRSYKRTFGYSPKALLFIISTSHTELPISGIPLFFFERFSLYHTVINVYLQLLCLS